MGTRNGIGGNMKKIKTIFWLVLTLASGFLTVCFIANKDILSAVLMLIANFIAVMSLNRELEG